MLKRTLFLVIFGLALSPQCLFADNPHPKKAPAEYVVQEGDYLWKISKTVWGEGKKWLFIYAANVDQIKDPNLVYNGQKLAIPSELTPDLIRKAHNLVADAEAAAPVPKNQSPSTKQAAPPQNSSTVPEEKTTSPMAMAQNPVPAAREDAGSGHGVLWAIGVLILIIGGFVGYISKKSKSPGLQTPKPLSQYRPTDPVTTAPARPVQASVSSEVLAADSFVEQGRYIEAVRAYKDILEKEPGNIEVGKRLMRVEDKIKLRVVENTKPVTPVQPPPVEPKPVEPVVENPSTEITQAPPSSLEKKPPEPSMSSGTMTNVSEPKSPSSSPVEPGPPTPAQATVPTDETKPPV